MAGRKALAEKLQRIQSIFDTQALLSRDAERSSSISRYYRTNRLAYRWLHSPSGFVHMGLSEGDDFHPRDLQAQAEVVKEYFSTRTEKVLELAIGKGANSRYLARHYPRISFEGIDLPHGQMDGSVDLHLRNLTFQSGDYHSLSSYKNNTFDVVFIIEALCHSTRKVEVFSEVKRVLKPNGYFIIIDGSADRAEGELTNDELLARKLTEKGMMVALFEAYSSIRSALTRTGFTIIREENVTRKIMPSLRRIERMWPTKAFFKWRPLARFIVKILPNEFTGNAVSGHLLPDLCELQVLRYDILVAQKPR